MHRAEPSLGLGARRGRRPAVGHELRLEHLDVKAQLGVDVGTQIRTDRADVAPPAVATHGSLPSNVDVYMAPDASNVNGRTPRSGITSSHRAGRVSRGAAEDAEKSTSSRRKPGSPLAAVRRKSPA